MKMRNGIFFLLVTTLIAACSPVKVPLTKQFQLSTHSQKVFGMHKGAKAIIVTLPEGVAGYQTEKMLYVKKPFELEAFAQNAWVASPATMLHPLIVESLQKSRFFRVVASTLYAEPVDYRLDTQLLKLHQNFTVKPSVLELSVKVVLTDVAGERILASRIIELKQTCPTENPYGGVIAANRATEILTAGITRFVMGVLNDRSIPLKR